MRGSKYRNIRTNGSASKKEAKRKLVLEQMERNGEIEDLQCQVTFELIPVQREPDMVGPRGGIKKGKVIAHSCKYIADFVYKKDGKMVVEDTKGFRTEGYGIKKKLMLWRYGIQIKET